MRQQAREGLALFGRRGDRKYLNADERRRFVDAAREASSEQQLFCLMLRWSGGRVSEILAVTPAAVDLESGVVSLKTLKRRRPDVVRQVPLPSDLLAALDQEFHLRATQGDPIAAHQRIWRFSRTTAWRYVKAVMTIAGIQGLSAMPKGLRHSFGVNAFQSNVPPHLVQRWLGHASLKTTAIYGDVVGPEERELAARMWAVRPARSH